MESEAWPRSGISWGRNMSVCISEPFSSQELPGHPAGLTLKQQVTGRATTMGEQEVWEFGDNLSCTQPSKQKMSPLTHFCHRCVPFVVNYFLFYGVLRNSASVRFVFKE